MMEKTLLCFGDSNTYGYLPIALDDENERRYPRYMRWPGILQQQLGAAWHVVEEGLPGRTFGFDDPESPCLNGLAAIEGCLRSHAPLDAVVLMLGTNDAKRVFAATAADILPHARAMVQCILQPQYGVNQKPPALLLVSPIAVGPNLCPPHLGGSFGPNSAPLVEQLRAGLQQLAAQNNLMYLNASQVAQPSPLDGLHMDEQGHEALAGAIYKILQAI